MMNPCHLVLQNVKGGNVGHQLAHMYNVRFWKLENINNELVKDLKTIKSEDTKTIESLINVHNISTEKIAEVFKKKY